MKLYFIECLTGCNCCQHMSHYRGPYQSYGDADRRRQRLVIDCVSEFHTGGKFWVIEKTITHTISFGMVVWVMDGQWFYESDIIAVGDDGSISYSPLIEKFCGIDEL